MKLRSVIKLGKKNKTTSKELDDDVMSKNCDFIAIFPIYGQFGAVWKSGPGTIVCKTYTFINSKLLSHKN